MPSDPSEPALTAGLSSGGAMLPFERMFELSPLATCLTRRRDGCLLAVNRAWEVLTGLTREQVLGKSGVDLGLWPQAQDRARYVEGLERGEEPRCATLIGGVQRHVRLITTEITDGPEPMLLVYLLDISHEAQAEEQRDRTQAALESANRDLQQQVELYGAIEKLAQVGHWTNAASDEEVIWSQGLCDLAGISDKRTLSRHLGRSGIHPDDRAAWLAAREAMDGRTVEFRWQRPDNGQMIWLRTRMGRTSVAGNPQTDFGVVQDISAEKAARQALAEQLDFIHNITTRVPGVVFQGWVPVQGWGKFGYVSDTVRELLDLEPDQLYADGRSLFLRVHPEDVDDLNASIWESTTRLTFWRRVFRVNHPSKGIRWCSAEGLPQQQTDGSVLWHGYVHDVTEARQAAQELERQHRMLDAVRLAQAAYIEADDKRQAFEGLLKAFLTVTDSAFGFVGEVLYDEAGSPYLKTHAITNIAWNDITHRLVAEQMDAGLEFRNLKTLFGHSLVTGETVITNDPASHPRSAGLPPGHPPMSSYMGIPLALGDQLIAMVAVANTPGGYREEDVEFLQPLLGTVRQLVLARRGHAERQRSRLQLQATSALLAEKSAALQVTLDSISQGLSKMDAQGRVMIYNRRLLEMLDLPDELMSRQPSQEEVVRFQTARGDFGPAFSLVEPQARSFIADDSVPAPGVYMRRTGDGRALEIRTRTLPDGGMVRTYTDVTSYIEAEQALRDERQRLEWVLEATGPGIWELDVTTEQLMFSERWAALLGYGLDELQPSNRDTWRALVHPDDLDRAQSALQTHLRGQTEVYDCDLRMRHKRGDWLWFNDRGRVHQRNDQGEPLYMSGTLLDIHLRVTAQDEVRALNASLERRVAERTAELERSMRDMEVISYSIAHDLRAPLRSVNGFASLVEELDGERLSPEGRMMFVRIVAASRNMGQMITDMLELLRVVRVEIEPVAVDMNALARSVVEALAPGVPHARINLHLLPRVMGDAKLLRQLLANLIDNALKYSRHRSEPVIDLGYDRERGAFYLRDNGMGFDMAHAHKLFGLFQRLHAGASAPGGTGVGLAIVARTLERHGGRIWAEAEPGVGATFWWSLPLV